jgi:hypothetical protein
VRSVLTNRPLWIGIGAWAATRGLVVADISHLQDVNNYAVWSHYLTDRGAIPGGESWQYPPGAAFLMLLPRLGPGTYGESFVALMLIFDFAGLGLLALLGRRCGSYKGVWVWLLGMPLLGTFAVLRFDLAPAVIAIAALVVIHRRPRWFGALAGLGAAIKLWPAALLFGEWDRWRLLRASAAAIAVLALVFGVCAIAFGDPASFLHEQGGRGLQEEAVATLPWQAKAVFTGDLPPRAIRYGAWQIAGGDAETVAGLLELSSLVVLVAAAAWWRLRAKAIRAGRTHLAEESVSRDFVFAVVLLLVVTSRVLSPQYMVWLLGLAAVVLTAGTTRLARPAWLVLGSMALTTALFKSPASILIRNLLLLAATIDASIAMAALPRSPGPHPQAAVRAGPPPAPGSSPPDPGHAGPGRQDPQSPARAAR